MRPATLARGTCATTAALLLFAAPSLAGQVHLVDGGGGGDFTTLQAAVNAAAEGDTIIVNATVYGGAAADAIIDGKSLDIVGGSGVLTQPVLIGKVEVRGLTGTQEVHMQGLYIEDLVIDQCVGDVLLEHMNLEDWTSYAQRSLTVNGSNNVTATDSKFVGSDGWDACGGSCNNGADGGPGVAVESGRLHLYHCDLEGGLGEDGAWLPCGIGGNGGDALLVTGTTSRVRYLATTFTPGLYGLGGCGDGWSGATINAPAGTVAEFTTPVTRLDGPATATAGTAVSIDIVGPPGATVYLLTTTDMRHRLLPLSAGTLHMKSFTLEVLPQVPPSGTLVHTVSLPTLPPGAEARWRLMQAVFSQSGYRFLGPPRALISLR